ncbi:hypothetical protein HBI56_042980 [Parastagonospora nodorum]|uniref:Uncharacterized protein n=2 Tax=Phaeosphaeria nodorum (strain SN15 / ATCC MYA-4574 / FGSC 10173) TaxID=321614 RepID=A0A7U2EY26_PHANO|nr:hypothetical protein SNOG_03377 [Parastagonospora nodorum SN15]KAH3904030.1 hypothetical protein HBH56_240130 [Parastagonospora nodorum]EAT88582.1 hypothetical protein SNOG_03377 [Parastagonospora nodorum SN15]KAH3932700.1 hypothetical protein HBH54_084310 [Parastagonospora nodorum]KAH3986085.1 hypothetical protein HBH52_041260 [Parastagonospora nodorum]KAH4005003.1 hypothetical protein HBI10_046280 [Parastagonospora nodorum]
MSANTSSLDPSAPAFVPDNKASSSTSAPRTIENQGEPDDDLGMPNDDIKDPLAYRTVDNLVALLMYPGKGMLYPEDKHGNTMHDRVLIRLDWVKRTVSEKHFIFDSAKGRSVLRGDSKIRTHGRLAGLPMRYYNWLCGNDIDESFFRGYKEQLWLWRVGFVRYG